MLTPESLFTVSQLNARARQLLEISFASVRVEGEISNLARPSSGHWYFTLKDNNAQVRCAMFRSRTALLKFQPKDGDKVELRAKVSLYEGRGDYQLIVDSMRPAGEGALLIAFQELKDRLALEGLFSNEHKKPLPASIRRIGVVTSATGAALHDILSVLKRRDPSLSVAIYPTAVQGKEASAQIISAIERANRDRLVDVLIVGRGGGSLEDLWCFNEEAVARAIFASSLPVVSAVGHEVDFTIADFVADLRAPTPSAAAELVSQDNTVRLQYLAQLNERLARTALRSVLPLKQKLQQLTARLPQISPLLQRHFQTVDSLEMRAVKAVRAQLKQQQQSLNGAHNRLHLQHPKRQLERNQNKILQLKERLARSVKSQQKNTQWRLDSLHPRLSKAISMQQLFARQKLSTQAKLLQSVSPLNVLARGYSLTQNENGKLLRQAQDAKEGDIIQTRLQKGWIRSKVVATDSEGKKHD